MSTRREFIAVAAALPVAAQHEHTETVAAAYEWKVFSSEERLKVAGIVDLIIPRTDTPGASDVHVPEFIDRKLSLDAGLKERFLAGLAKFNGIDELDPFFKLVKGLTVDGYYTSKEGLTQELGWHGNTFLTEFKGCTHADHQ